MVIMIVIIVIVFCWWVKGVIITWETWTWVCHFVIYYIWNIV